MGKLLGSLVKWFKGRLIAQIVAGLITGIVLTSIWPASESVTGLFGSLFVKALRAVAPILVFFLVTSSIANKARGVKTHVGRVLILYIVGMVFAALTAVGFAFAFPVKLQLPETATTTLQAPEGVSAVLMNLLDQMFQNPVQALVEANFIGILVWAVALGILLHKSSPSTRQWLKEWAEAMNKLVEWVICLAPLGIMGLVATTVADTGIAGLRSYLDLIILLIGVMLVVVTVVNPLIVFVTTRRNPYPLVWRCLKESGVTAFFTRSSAANIPVNMELCKKLKLHRDTYSVSIPLGATVNMGGAAITITILALTAANARGVEVSLITASLLCIMASASACGASGVAGGSLLLVPVACSLLGMDQDTAMQMVSIGFVISVIQDSAETALNSSTDVLFTAAACLSAGDVEEGAEQ